MHFRIPSARPATLRRGRIRCRGQGRQSGGKTETAEESFRRARALCLRRACGRSLPNAAAIGARRTRDHGFKFALSQEKLFADDFGQREETGPGATGEKNGFLVHALVFRSLSALSW